MFCLWEHMGELLLFEKFLQLFFFFFFGTSFLEQMVLAQLLSAVNTEMTPLELSFITSYTLVKQYMYEIVINCIQCHSYLFVVSTFYSNKLSILFSHVTDSKLYANMKRNQNIKK